MCAYILMQHINLGISLLNSLYLLGFLSLVKRKFSKPFQDGGSGEINPKPMITPSSLNGRFVLSIMGSIILGETGVAVIIVERWRVHSSIRPICDIGTAHCHWLLRLGCDKSHNSLPNNLISL